MRKAACVVAFRDDGKVLAVSRGASPTFAFPGGGIEPGETPVQAAARELYEETGYVPLALLPLTERSGFSTFIAQGLVGSLRSSSEGVAVWVDPQLVTGSSGTFPETARKALAAVSMGRYHTTSSNLLPRCFHW